MTSALFLFQLCILSFLKKKMYLLLFSYRKQIWRRQTSSDATNGTILTFIKSFVVRFISVTVVSKRNMVGVKQLRTLLLKWILMWDSLREFSGYRCLLFLGFFLLNMWSIPNNWIQQTKIQNSNMHCKETVLQVWKVLP